MINILQSYLLFRESFNGVKGVNDHKMDTFHYLPDDVEKVLAPLVLIYMREMTKFDESSLNIESSQIFITFINLLMGCN